MNLVGGSDLEQQMVQSLENVKIALAAGGATLQDVVRLDIYVVNYKPTKVDSISAALSRFFDPDHLPANTLLGVQALALPQFLVEVTATAVVDG